MANYPFFRIKLNKVNRHNIYNLEILRFLCRITLMIHKTVIRNFICAIKIVLFFIIIKMSNTYKSCSYVALCSENQRIDIQTSERDKTDKMDLRFQNSNYRHYVLSFYKLYIPSKEITKTFLKRTLNLLKTKFVFSKIYMQYSLPKIIHASEYSHLVCDTEEIGMRTVTLVY